MYPEGLLTSGFFTDMYLVPNDFLSKMLGVKVRKPHSLLFVMERKSPSHKMVFVTDL